MIKKTVKHLKEKPLKGNELDTAADVLMGYSEFTISIIDDDVEELRDTLKSFHIVDYGDRPLQLIKEATVEKMSYLKFLITKPEIEILDDEDEDDEELSVFEIY